MSVKFNDYSDEVIRILKANEAAAMAAVGIKAVNLILWQMRQGYGKPIRQTGDLQRDVSFEAVDDKTVNVGNTLEYAVYVHEGTRKMAARNYITDAFNSRDNVEKMRKVCQEYLKKGFE